VPNAEIYPISALENFNVKEVFARIIELLPESPAYYPKDALTDKPERFFVNETIREKILLNYDKEIPYAVEIETEEFIEDDKVIFNYQIPSENMWGLGTPEDLNYYLENHK
jgi:GTP-binding protein Era